MARAATQAIAERRVEPDWRRFQEYRVVRVISDRQQRFVDEYLVDCNATQAAIRAGYSVRTAQEQGSRLLSNVMVSAAIAEAQISRSERTAIKADQVLRELARIGFASMGDFIKIGPDGVPYTDLGALSTDKAAAIQYIHVEIIAARTSDDADPSRVSKIRLKLHDKRAALVDLGKHLGLFKERVEVGVDDRIKRLFEQLTGKVFRPTNG